MSHFKHVGKYIFLFAFLLLIDRISKALVLAYGKFPFKVFQFLAIHLSFNRGVSWGMFHSDAVTPFLIISVLTGVIVSLLALYTVSRIKKGYSVWGEAIVLAGATSNLIDRISYGGVIDFIYFFYGRWSWPVFNIADMCIVFGVLVILFGVYKES